MRGSFSYHKYTTNISIALRTRTYVKQKSFSSMYASSGQITPSGLRVIDLRSDTVTTPTNEMRAAMIAAEVGDDVYGEDPSVNALQAKAAKLTGKEAGLFVPSGTMGNLISVMAHCVGRGDEILVGDIAHITIWEQGGVAQVGGVHPRQVRTNPDGTLNVSDLESKIRPWHSGDCHLPVTRLICIEQTHNGAGGRVLSIEYLTKLKNLATKYNLKVHMDGARLFNAATALDVPVSCITEHVDSVSFCLSKGLGAPVGSIIVGAKDFIAKYLYITHITIKPLRCARHRKVLGGGMRQAGILAAAGIYALDIIAPKLKQDHANAKLLAKGIHALSHLGLHIDLESVESNMVFFTAYHPKITADELVSRMEDTTLTDGCPEELGIVVKIYTAEENSNRIRAVLHHQISEDDVYITLRKLELILT